MIPIDEAACGASPGANLESVDFVGLHEHYDDFVGEVSGPLRLERHARRRAGT